MARRLQRGLLVCLVASTSVARVIAATPLLFRVSSGAAAAANETLILSGVGLNGATARLCTLRGGGACVSLPAAPSSWEGGLKVTLPLDALGAFSIAACAPSGECSDASQAARFFVNAPRVEWLLGEGGGAPSSVALGGTLRIFGAALALDTTTGVCAPIRAADARYPPGSLSPAAGASTATSLSTPPANTRATLSLCDDGGACIMLPPPSLASCHRLDVAIPPTTPPGTYTLRVDNAFASSAEGMGTLDHEPRVTVFAPTPVPPSTWVVGTDCSIVDCLAAAAAAGGGRVSVPAGVWDVPANAALDLPPHTELVGVGAWGAGPSSVLRWGSNTPAGAPAAALTCMGGHARVTSLALLFTTSIGVGLRFIDGVSDGGCTADGVNVTIDVEDAYPIGAPFAVDGARGWSLTGAFLFQRGNCSRSWPHNTGYTVWGASDGLFANTTVVCYCQGHSSDSSSRIVFDGNAVFAFGALGSEGSGYSTFESPQVLEHIYEGRRLDVGNVDSIKRYESMTLDGPGGAYFGTVVSASSDGSNGLPQTITLAAPARAPGPYPGSSNVSSYIGGSVSILYGPGLGALARVASITPDAGSGWATASVWTLSPPLVGLVLGESYVAINPYRGGMTFEGVTFVNATTFQLWAQATDVMVAGSYFQDVSGDVRNWPLQYQCPWTDGFPCAWQPNVATAFHANTLRCAHALNVVTSDYKAVPPVNLTLGVALSRRRNTLLGGTNMAMSGRVGDVLVEHTAFGEAACGGGGGGVVPAGSVVVGEGVSHVLVR